MAARWWRWRQTDGGKVLSDAAIAWIVSPEHRFTANDSRGLPTRFPTFRPTPQPQGPIDHAPVHEAVNRNDPSSGTPSIPCDTGAGGQELQRRRLRTYRVVSKLSVRTSGKADTLSGAPVDQTQEWAQDKAINKLCSLPSCPSPPQSIPGVELETYMEPARRSSGLAVPWSCCAQEDNAWAGALSPEKISTDSDGLGGREMIGDHMNKKGRGDKERGGGGWGRAGQLRGPQDKMWKAGETIFPGLDFLRAHASLSSLPLTANGLDHASALALNLHSRGGMGGGDHHSSSHLSPTKGSSPPPSSRAGGGGTPSPRPGSANITGPPPPPPPPPPHLLSSGLNALNLIHQQQQQLHHHHHSLLHGMTSSSSSGPTTLPSLSSTPGGSSGSKPPPPLHPSTPLHHLSKPSSYSSPPPLACNPEHNVCKLIEYRGAQVAAFMVDGRELICLPQAFELFLKHLVGGLHTVYTKLKRLEITPIVCNVEQVRILRGLGAIQPGVNRCKLISCSEFDTLYEDCTNSKRYGGPLNNYSPIETNWGCIRGRGDGGDDEEEEDGEQDVDSDEFVFIIDTAFCIRYVITTVVSS
ncbi:hypothetical protein EGW08_008019 [Elysia chlorotica]|uniref:SKI/SNO/DAC domain-containing protein n=1 Tax=Elysia chlorotica TaxID=188477 RepID=A0A433TRJ5_ELYCH|nr:hypothetical protein EGW08_008019 [Elysia chlorotica]